MRALRLVAGAAVMLGAIAACGQSTNNATPANQGGSTSTTETRSTVPGQSSAQAPPITGTGVPPGGTVLPKDQIDTGGLPDASLQREVAVGPDGRTLTLNVMARDACSGVEATVTEETADVVRILLTPMANPQGGPPDQMCAQVLTPRQVTVQLKEPLGKRKVFIKEGY